MNRSCAGNVGSLSIHLDALLHFVCIALYTFGCSYILVYVFMYTFVYIWYMCVHMYNVYEHMYMYIYVQFCIHLAAKRLILPMGAL